MKVVGGGELGITFTLVSIVCLSEVYMTNDVMIRLRVVLACIIKRIRMWAMFIYTKVCTLFESSVVWKIRQEQLNGGCHKSEGKSVIICILEKLNEVKITNT